MRQALLRRDAALALGAARDAPGVATLWTVAGILGGDRAALEKACELDPFNPFPPFHLMTLDPEAVGASRRGAHALLAEPRLAAATFWEAHLGLLDRTDNVLRRWPEVDPGWKEELVRRFPSPSERRGPTARLGLEIDTDPPRALSLHTFRRRPFPIEWPLVRVRLAPLPRLDLPPATTLPGPAFDAICPATERPTHEQGMRTR
jgi:hypothetical protein